MTPKYLSPEQADGLRQSFSAWLLIEPFLANLRLGNRSPGTIAEYRKVLHMFCLEVSCDLRVSLTDLRTWVAGMHDRGLKPSTISTRLTVLRSFYNFARDEGLAEANPIARLPQVKLGRRLPKALSPEEIRAFFNAVDARQDLERGPRDRLLFSLLYTCGLRVGEVVTLRCEHVNLETASLRVVGKGDKERMVPIRPEVLPALTAWTKGRDRGWLFHGEYGAHLSTRVVQQYCNEYGQAAGIPRRVHPHMLRHSCATHYLTGGAPITFVQSLLGHANLGTTGIYTQLADSERARIAREVELAI
jgi:site-specific recombinase XerD